jgi:demethylmenaquinone methyltransferase / 2-methoxy-6-polyprenyl-1,4-benzoquinol methylase
MTRADTSGERSGPPGENAEADFGYRRVGAGEKAGLVRGVFDSVAARYDLMNDLMSGGIHRLWKGELVDRVNPRPGERILDIAGGTGDVAQRLLRRAAGRGGPAATIVLCDINEAMLRRGRDRAIDANILAGIDYLAADAERLPIASAAADAYTIAFGLRNVTDIAATLREARRVLRPGGRFFCLEFSHVAPAFLARAYDLYSFGFLPALGQMVTGDREAYRYLVESIRRFPPQAELAAMMREAGLEQVRFRDLTFGVAAIHSGWRL